MVSSEFAGKRALVTGGRKGISEAVVGRFRSSCATVFTAARTASPDLDHRDLFVEADIGTADGVEKIAAHALARLGGVDILV